MAAFASSGPAPLSVRRRVSLSRWSLWGNANGGSACRRELNILWIREWRVHMVPFYSHPPPFWNAGRCPSGGVRRARFPAISRHLAIRPASAISRSWLGPFFSVRHPDPTLPSRRERMVEDGQHLHNTIISPPIKPYRPSSVASKRAAQRQVWSNTRFALARRRDLLRH